MKWFYNHDIKKLDDNFWDYFQSASLLNEFRTPVRLLRFLDKEMLSLIYLSYKLIFLSRKIVDTTTCAEDMSFKIYPIAKAFEGFIKKLLLKLNIIRVDRFRKHNDLIQVASYLNPSENNNLKFRSYFHKRSLAPVKIWATWQEWRNNIFHYNFNKRMYLDNFEAAEAFKSIIDVMLLTVEDCKNIVFYKKERLREFEYFSENSQHFLVIKLEKEQIKKLKKRFLF